MTRQDRIAALKAAAKERVLILDGSWGVMFQKRGLTEADYRGDRFLDHPGQMKGNNDILCLTRTDIVADLHDQYYAAGADISATLFAPSGFMRVDVISNMAVAFIPGRRCAAWCRPQGAACATCACAAAR